MRYAEAAMSEAADHDLSHLSPAAAGLGHVFARTKMLAAFCVIILASLGWLYSALVFAGMDGSFGGFGLSAVQALCRPLSSPSWSVSTIAILALMWGAMTLAMMLPSAAPMILTYAGIADTAAHKNENIVSPFALAAGYAAVWMIFAVLAALIQTMLIQVALLDASMRSESGLFSSAIFIGAGLYQFSRLKHSCLSHCQQPFPFFFANWATTPSGVFCLGVKQGLYCLGCCWAMMLVMFTVGVMNVVWMAGIGVIMTIEKLLAGRRFAHVIGVMLIVVGASIGLAAFAGSLPEGPLK
jgi:predicted metal-binding membrane protein